MKIEKQVNALWNELQDAIDASSHDGDTLGDYKSDSYHKNLDRLLSTSIAEERGHRGFVGGSYQVSAPIGAKIIILSNVADGTRRREMPPSQLWMQLRRTAVEGMVLGYILREDLPADWHDRANALDYADIMNGKQTAA